MFSRNSTNTLLVFASLSFLVACSKPSAPAIEKDSATQNEILQERSIVDAGLAGTKILALTFDDGPVDVATDELLDLLAKHRIKSTFFMVGEHIYGRENTVVRMVRDGHILANHTQTHAGISRKSLDPQFVYRQLIDAHNVILPFVRDQRNLYFRAPGGMWNGSIAHLLNQDPNLAEYIGPVYWNIGGELRFDANKKIAAAADWACWEKAVSPAVCADGYLRESDRKRGGVVLMHDHINTNAMLKILIPEWKRRGYKFVTLDQIPKLDTFK